MASSPFKKIIVCCDGTWNDSDGTNQPPTNVTKIARSIAHENQNNGTGKVIPQLVYYQSGIGTKSPNDADHLYDGMFGRGISEHIREAYGFICNNYDPGDELFLIGFSRGAFTARCISSLVHDIGLLTKRGMGYFSDIFRIWEEQNQIEKDDDSNKMTTLPELRKRFVDPTTEFSRMPVPIKACAVWDTVGALGIPIDGVHDPFEFVNTAVCDNIENAFHAMALDEHRKPFTPTIWEKPDGQHWPTTLKQCWFTGVHTHIGGGNDQNNSLPNIALAWMIAQLTPFIEFDCTSVQRRNQDRAVADLLHFEGELEVQGNVEDSFTPAWLVAGSLHRTPGRYRRPNPKNLLSADLPLLHTNETVHSTVRHRFWDQSIPGWTDRKHLWEVWKADKYESKALKDWKYEQTPKHRWVYTGHVDEDEKPYELLEDEMSKVEYDILRTWSSNDAIELSELALAHVTH